jgi:Fe2+ or Zn2+ uptake regulation protein
MDRHARAATPGRAAADGDELAVAVLRPAGLTATGPRRAVYRVLVGQERPVSAAEGYQLLRGRARSPG